MAMVEPCALVVIRYEDLPSLVRAILQINITRRQRFFYRSLVLTAPRRGWVALLLGEGGGMVDHLLMRNLSGRLRTIAFELRLGQQDLAYRFHQEGRTVSAFESNLAAYVSQRLRSIEASRDASVLDLSEPLERFVLKRYHELQHPDTVITLSLKIPGLLQAHYSSDAASLTPLFRDPAMVAEVTALLAPGLSPEQAFEGLVSALDLPFLPPDTLVISAPDGERLISGLEILRPDRWIDFLPEGWLRMPSIPPPLAGHKIILRASARHGEGGAAQGSP